MSENVSVLLEALRGGKNNFEVVEYDDTKNASDTSRVFEMQRKKNVAGLLDFWKNKCEEKFFELTHPEKDVTTRAVHSVQYGMANFVFMLDENGRNAWVMVQCQLAIDCMITDKFIYKNNRLSLLPITKHLTSLSCTNPDDLFYDDVDFYFSLSQRRPYHYFYDHLKFFLKICGVKPAYESSSFFFPARYKRQSGTEGVLLFPGVLGNNIFNQASSDYIKYLNEDMESFVYKESMSSHVRIYKLHGKDGLVLWFGVTGQKRRWLEQVEGCINIVKNFKFYFDNITLYVDGMTAKQGERISSEEDDAVFRQIEKGLADVDGVAVASLVGRDYKEKIVCCDSVDFFIANAGSGCMVPLRFVKKPGVLHSNTELFTFPDEYPGYVKRVDDSYVVDVYDGATSQAMHVSYHIPWQHIFNLAVEILNEIKGIEIAKLHVPPVAEVKNAYDQRIQAQEEIKNHFMTLVDRAKLDLSSPSILREVAFAFEKAGDMHTAMKVMEKAHLLRPQGPVIKRKLEEYRKALEK